ncbi:MAG: hypothetical protein QOD99_486 [Chthoniobacter sp.]|jgi:hypothetical protein|nr:hypothetical protein [Chthoniobacter sp.]
MKFVMLLLVATSIAARAEINLTPTASVRVLDGCSFPQLEFHDEGKTITYEPPAGWSYASGGKNALTLRPKNKVQADAKIEVAASPLPLQFDPENLKVLQARVTASLPAQSEKIEVAEPLVDSLKIGGRSTCEFELTYVRFGQKYKVSILFVDLEKAQLTFTLSCLSADYEELHKQFRGSWFSWQ